jgi:ribosomal protein S8E
MKRWTRNEVRLAKDTLMAKEGNKTEAAAVLSKSTGRTEAACMMRLCKITDTYPAYKKRNILRKKAKVNTVVDKKQDFVLGTSAKVELYKDHIRIYF